MDIQKVREERRLMEKTILDATQEAMRVFKERTSLCPSSISIDLVGITRIGQSEREYLVDSVRASVDL